MAILDEWHQQIDLINGLENTYGGANFRRDRTVKQLIRSLRQYAEGQFRFFYEGFNPPNPKVFPTLKAYTNLGAGYGADAVVSDILGKITDDVGVISQIASDRFSEGLSSPVPTFREQMDNLAASALWPDYIPPVGHLLEEGMDYQGDFRAKTIITHFEPTRIQDDIVTVRVLPYAQVALIAVPINERVNLEELLSVPHEVGHFLYWYSYCSNFVLDPLHRYCASPDYRNIRERYYPYQPLGNANNLTWSEEIFADAYGTLIAGPLAVLRAQDLALEKLGRAAFDTINFNDPHPTPLIRPLGLLRAMLALRNPFQMNTLQPGMNTVIQQLVERWNGRVPSQYQYQFNAAAGTVTSAFNFGATPVYQTIDSAINKAVVAIKNFLDELQTPNKPRDWGWSQLPGTPNPNYIGQLDAQKAAIVGALLQNSLPPDEVDGLNPYPAPTGGAVPPLWLDWAVNGKGYLTGINPNGNALVSGDWNDMDPALNRRDRWFRVYGSGGWATEGPCLHPPN